jgi:predicted nucleic acid-binding protein
MTVALDASMAIAWCFEDERTPETEAVLDRVVASGAFVPSLWKIEVANGLQAALRRKRIDQHYRDRALKRLQDLPIETDPETSIHVWSAGIELADRHGLTLYDAVYLELAIRRAIPLASLDNELVEAGRQAGLPQLQ